jgi:prepilin-type N-terminal cleavage/methylation domain-containing protein
MCVLLLCGVSYMKKNAKKTIDRLPGRNSGARGALFGRLARVRRGFTLLEVMSVVAVIAIMSGIAVYTINTNLERIRADSGVRKVSFALNYARIRAISENTNYVVQFLYRNNPGKDEGTCYISMCADTDKDGTCDSNEVKRTEDLPVGIVFDLDGPKDINNATVSGSTNKDGIIFTDNKLTFFPRGNASESGAVYIIPKKNIKEGNDTNRRAVSLDRLSGRTVVWIYDVGRLAKGLCGWRLEGE